MRPPTIFKENLMTNNKIAKIKTWIKNHNDEIVIGAVITASAAAFVAITIYALKEQKEMDENEQRRNKEYTAFVNEALSSGAQIFNLLDGSLLTVDREGNKKITYIV